MVLYAYMCCVCIFLFHRESPDLILVDKPLISEVVLSHTGCAACEDLTRHGRAADGSAFSSCGQLASVSGDTVGQTCSVEVLQ
jgi:hypothetical protein